MGWMLHLAYQTKDAKGVLHGMPSPVDGDVTTPWPVDFWLEYLQLFTAHGGTVAVLPPVTKGASLGTGYDPYNHWDLGSNKHGPAGRRETRYGSVERIAAFVAAVRAMGMETYSNVVHHHLDGDRGDYVYDYISGDGKTPGKYPFDKSCFWVWTSDQQANPDTVWDASTDWGFGREFQWNLGTYGDGQGGNGPGYVRRALAAALSWQTDRLALDGYFLDDAKGTSAEYIGWLLNQGSMQNKLAFAELSDGNTNNLMAWMNTSQIGRRCGVLDFALRYKIRNVCNNAADMRQIMSEGVCWVDPVHAITFIEDIDLDISDPIIWRKELGYAMLAGFPGYPMIFGKDFYRKPVGYGLTDVICHFIWSHETLAVGDFIWRGEGSDYLTWERMGDGSSPGAVYGVTTRNSWVEVTVQTKWINQQLHDVDGQAEDKWTNSAGMLTFWIPPDQGAGKGHCCYTVVGLNNPIKLASRTTTQTILGGNGLDTPRMINGEQALTTVPLKNGTKLIARLDGVTATMSATTPSGAVVNGELDGGAWNLIAAEDGWHSINAFAAQLPDSGVPWSLHVTYTPPNPIP